MKLYRMNVADAGNQVDAMDAACPGECLPSS